MEEDLKWLPLALFHRWGNPFRLAASRQATFPKGTASGYAAKFPFSAKASPWGSCRVATEGVFFRPKFHVLGRKSQTIKQSAQKGGAKFGGGGLDRSREKVFKKQNDELKRVIATK